MKYDARWQGEHTPRHVLSVCGFILESSNRLGSIGITVSLCHCNAVSWYILQSPSIPTTSVWSEPKVHWQGGRGVWGGVWWANKKFKVQRKGRGWYTGHQHNATILHENMEGGFIWYVWKISMAAWKMFCGLKSFHYRKLNIKLHAPDSLNSTLIIKLKNLM